MLRVAAGASRPRPPSVQEEAPLCRELRTPPLPAAHVPVGYCWQHSRSCHSERSMTVTSATSCRTRTLVIMLTGTVIGRLAGQRSKAPVSLSRGRSASWGIFGPPRATVNAKRPGKNQFPAERTANLTARSNARLASAALSHPAVASDARRGGKPLAEQGAVSVYDRTAVPSATSCRTSGWFGLFRSLGCGVAIDHPEPRSLRHRDG